MITYDDDTLKALECAQTIHTLAAKNNWDKWEIYGLTSVTRLRESERSFIDAYNTIAVIKHIIMNSRDSHRTVEDISGAVERYLKRHQDND